MKMMKIEPGEMIIEKDKIVFCSVTSGYDGASVITLFPEGYDSVQMILDAIKRNNPLLLSIYYYTIRRRRLECTIRTLKMGRLSLLQDYEIIEVRFPWWRRLLSYLKPIKLYVIKYSPKGKKWKFLILRFRGFFHLSLLPPLPSL